MGWVGSRFIIQWLSFGEIMDLMPWFDPVQKRELGASAFISPIDENFLFISVVSCDLFLFWIRVQMALLFKDL